MTRRQFLWLTASALAIAALPPVLAQGPTAPEKRDKVVKSEAEWKKVLTPTQFWILRQAGTERAYTNALWNNHQKGTYACAACANVLFQSDSKFDSGTGWPSFFTPARKGAVIEKRDPDGERVEVLCSRCDGHLGHVFDDAPETPTGRRYCMNSGALRFTKAAPPAAPAPATANRQ